MMQDVGSPFIHIGESRDEIFIVNFDGFIKNPLEGIIRTMLRNYDYWIKEYPYLETYNEYTADDLYDVTMLFKPIDTLHYLSEGKKDKKDILHDLNIIYHQMIISNSKITSFEFSLYQLLKEPFMKKCYFFKEEPFYEIEIQYINHFFKDVLNKIEIVSGGFLTLFEEVHPTTVCIQDKDLVMHYMPNHYKNNEMRGVFFILLNDNENVEYNEELNTFQYKETFKKELLESNQTNDFMLSTIYNIPLISPENEENISSLDEN